MPRLSILMPALLCVSSACLAIDLGTIGPTYPIVEHDALKMIERQLKEKERTGELARIQKEATARSMASITSPPPVDGIGVVTERRSRVFDPSIVVQRTIADPMGRVIAEAGTRVNPLDYTPLSKRLIFIDGRDPAQLKAARAIIRRDGSLRTKTILVGGSWLDTMRAWKTQAYYDQGGRLTRHFSITRVPAIVRQDGKRLVIEEVPPQELK